MIYDACGIYIWHAWMLRIVTGVLNGVRYVFVVYESAVLRCLAIIYECRIYIMPCLFDDLGGAPCMHASRIACAMHASRIAGAIEFMNLRSSRLTTYLYHCLVYLSYFLAAAAKF